MQGQRLYSAHQLTQFNSGLLDQWRRFDEPLVAAVVDDFDRVIKALRDNDVPNQGNECSLIVAYWFSQMSPAQIDQCLDCQTNWFTLESTMIALSVFLERRDLSKETLIAVLTKALHIRLVQSQMRTIGFNGVSINEMEAETSA
jgi:hypothetical protein